VEFWGRQAHDRCLEKYQGKRKRDVNNQREQVTLNEYKASGAYHAELRLAREWLPRYYRRYHIVEVILSKYFPKHARIVDIGSGEGVFIQRLLKQGYTRVSGVDPYAPFISKQMVRGSIFALPFSEAIFDAVICLDVLEHIPLQLQREASLSLTRALKPGGSALISVPNMANLKSRIAFLLTGKPSRNKLEKHPGELSIHERIQVLRQAGLKPADSVGLHLTLSYDPHPEKPFGRLLSKIMFYPYVPASLCWSVLLLLYKPPKPEWIDRNLLRKALITYNAPIDDPTR